jgi:hypothetical protein
MKEVTGTAGVTDISQFDSMLTINGGRELKLSISLSTRQIIAVSNLFAIWTGHSENRIKIRTQSTSKHFRTHRLASR